jgi:hypothetical protein
MGFFSWITQDTEVSIPNVNSSQLPLEQVVLMDNKGNEWIESDYQGYGIFGGKDYYELLSEMNGYGSDREKGIELEFGISAIRSQYTGIIYQGSNVDFFNWETERLIDGKSANDLLKTQEWISIIIRDKHILYPNLIEKEYPNWKWKNKQPKNCPYQGFFY